jgi:integrase
VEPNKGEPLVSFPHVVTKRSGKATIYQTHQVKGGSRYTTFRVCTYQSDGKRVASYHSDFKEALRSANAKLDAMGRGLVDNTVLSGPDRLDYLSALKILDGKASLTDAANAWVQKQTKEAAATPMRVKDAVDGFMAAREAETKRAKPASAAYKSDFRRRLKKFADAFQCNLGDVTPTGIEAWLAATKQTGRNRFNTLRLVRTLFRWAQKRKHVPPGPIPTDDLDINCPPAGGAITTFTAAELSKLLHAAKPTMVPYVALGGLAGLRTAEITRLDWRDIKLDRGFIEVAADKAKTASRRLVPMGPALRAWLTRVRQDAGPVIPFANVGKQVGWLARDAGVEWKINALRHSFITYRVAELQDVQRVALEAGNSPAMIFKNYRELAEPAQAAAWFAVMPTTPALQ